MIPPMLPKWYHAIPGLLFWGLVLVGVSLACRVRDQDAYSDGFITSTTVLTTGDTLFRVYDQKMRVDVYCLPKAIVGRDPSGFGVDVVINQRWCEGNVGDLLALLQHAKLPAEAPSPTP